MEPFVMFMIILSLIQAIFIGITIIRLSRQYRRLNLKAILWLNSTLLFLVLQGFSQPIIKNMLEAPQFLFITAILNGGFILSYVIFIRHIYDKINQTLYRFILILTLVLIAVHAVLYPIKDNSFQLDFLNAFSIGLAVMIGFGWTLFICTRYYQKMPWYFKQQWIGQRYKFILMSNYFMIPQGILSIFMVFHNNNEFLQDLFLILMVVCTLGFTISHLIAWVIIKEGHKRTQEITIQEEEGLSDEEIMKQMMEG